MPASTWDARRWGDSVSPRRIGDLEMTGEVEHTVRRCASEQSRGFGLVQVGEYGYEHPRRTCSAVPKLERLSSGIFKLRG